MTSRREPSRCCSPTSSSRRSSTSCSATRKARGDRAGDGAARAGARRGHRGVVVKELGDGLMAVFSSARRAVAAPVRSSSTWPGATVAIRTAGAHAHRAAHRRDHRGGRRHPRRDGDHRPAHRGRRPARRHPRSETVHMVLGTARDELDDRGMFDLKGIASPWHLYEVPCHDPEVPTVQQVTMTPYVGRVAERDATARPRRAASPAGWADSSSSAARPVPASRDSPPRRSTRPSATG